MIDTISMQGSEDTKFTQTEADALDLDFLRDQALAKAQELSGELWTDYNPHDPGVTILESLCFASAELAMRINAMRERFSDKADHSSMLPSPSRHEDAYMACTEVTPSDFRDLALLDGRIKNTYLIPSQTQIEYNGVRDLGVELRDTVNSEEDKEEIVEKLREYTSSARALTSVVQEIIFLEPEFLCVDLTIELSMREVPSGLVSELLDTIEAYISPQSRQRVDATRGRDASQAGQSKPSSALYISDLVSAVMELEEVSLVREVQLIDKQGEQYNWFFDVPSGKVPALDRLNSQVKVVFRDNEIYQTNLMVPSGRLLRNASAKDVSDEHIFLEILDEIGLPMPPIHHSFPKKFGVGELGVPPSASLKEQSSAKQLEAYLSFFEQLILSLQQTIDVIVHSLAGGDPTRNGSTAFQEIPRGGYLFKPFLDKYLGDFIAIDDRLLQQEWKRFLEAESEGLTAVVQEGYLSKYRINRIKEAYFDQLLTMVGFSPGSVIFDLESYSNQRSVRKETLLQRFPKLAANKRVGPRLEDLLDASCEYYGFCAWFKELIGLNREHFGSITQGISELLKDPSGEPKKDGLNRVSLFGVTEEDAFAELLSIGGAIVNYNQAAEAVYEVRNADTNRVAIRFTGSDAELSYFTERVRQANDRCESFHLIDHVLLRPRPYFKCHGLRFEIAGVQFSGNCTHTRAKRESFISQLTSTSVPPDFDIIEMAVHQYRVVCVIGEESFVSNNVYDSSDSAREAKELCELQLKYGRFDLERITLFNGLYKNCKDPFSYVLSLILPNWTSAFQKVGVREEVQAIVAKETPAFAAVQVKWVGFQEMKALEDALKVYLDAVSVPLNDATEELSVLMNEVAQV